MFYGTKKEDAILPEVSSVMGNPGSNIFLKCQAVNVIIFDFCGKLYIPFIEES